LQEAFAVHGEVTSARIIKDRLTSRSRGFGFVEMANEEEGKKALEALAGADLMGRAISVREARPREEGAEKTPGERPPRAERGNNNGGESNNGERAPRGERGNGGGRNDRGNNGNGGGNNGGNGNNGGRNREPREPREAQPAPVLNIIQRGVY
jgi:cold-inducible RNA-binding protein